METNNHKIVDFDTVPDAKFGKEGSEERQKAEEMAFAFYTGKIILQARKQEKMTQEALAKKAVTNESYISKIENGTIEPSAGLFYRIIAALGLRIEIVKTIA